MSHFWVTERVGGLAFLSQPWGLTVSYRNTECIPVLVFLNLILLSLCLHFTERQPASRSFLWDWRRQKMWISLFLSRSVSFTVSKRMFSSVIRPTVRWLSKLFWVEMESRSQNIKQGSHRLNKTLSLDEFLLLSCKYMGVERWRSIGWIFVCLWPVI